MTGAPVNLNRVRKARARAERRAEADRNAVLHGLPKAAKALARAENARTGRAHAAGRRDPNATPPDEAE
jgi:hypothetical protein